MKALHFGAGNIGRGFIGLVLAENGYSITFADVNGDLIDKLKEAGEYTVILANEKKETILVEDVDGVNSSTEVPRLQELVLNTDVITTAVGPSILKFVAKSIAPGIKRRLEISSKPLNIIACENAINATDNLKKELFALLSPGEIEKAEKLIGFPNSAVDRIVPIQHNENPLDVMVEPFFEWVIEKNKLAGTREELKGVHYVDSLKPYIERKLLTVNTAHASTAYCGLYYGYETIVEAIKDEQIETLVRGVLSETSKYLIDSYGFNKKEHADYVNITINRFKNPLISDELTRVARSPIRKISPNERLMLPATKLTEAGFEVTYLPEIVALALMFKDNGDAESLELTDFLKENSVADALVKYSALEKDSPLSVKIVDNYNNLKK